MAYFSTLSLFPLIVAAVAIASFVISSTEIKDVSAQIMTLLPPDIAGLINAQLQNAVGQRSSNIVAATAAILVSLYGASGAVQNLMQAANAAYEKQETRGFIKTHVIGLVMTLAIIFGGFIVIGLISLSRGILTHLGIPDSVITTALYLRWAILPLMIFVGLGLFYYFGTNRAHTKLRIITVGSVIATAVWLIGTIAFFVYVQYFGNFSKSYSLFAGIIVTMVWLNLSAFIVLLGAEINHQLIKKKLLT